MYIFHCWSISFLLQSGHTFWADIAPNLSLLNHYYQYQQQHPVFTLLVTLWLLKTSKKNSQSHWYNLIKYTMISHKMYHIDY